MNSVQATDLDAQQLSITAVSLNICYGVNIGCGKIYSKKPKVQWLYVK